MKIIFESEEEKNKFVKRMENEEICPSAMFLKEIENCKGYESCSRCWEFAINSNNVKEDF